MRPSRDILQLHVAQVAIGPSTVRGKGNTGVAGAARRFLARLDLGQFATATEQAFVERLDDATGNLASALPAGAQHWGLARKCLNIFLRDAFYNRFLSAPIEHCEPWFEIPLDGVVARALRGTCPGLPGWEGVRGLTPGLSATYQRAARDMAAAQGVARVYLDSQLWVAGRMPGADAARR